MNLNALAKKAAKGPAPAAYGGAMEVEDMIRFTLFHGPIAADEIERLQRQHQWVMDGVLPDGGRVVPFGRWAVACVALGRQGVAGLRPLLDDPAMAEFAVSVLEKVRSAESVEALVNYCATARFAADGYTHPEWVEWQAVMALNDLLAFDDFVPVPVATLEKLQGILMVAFERASNAFLKGTALWAMRGVPTEAALKWVKGLQLEAPELVSTQKKCIKAIQKRLSPGFKPLNAEQKRQLRKERAANV